MRRFAALTTALALGVTCALLVSSCGDGGGGTLSSARADEINQLLDQIEERAAAGDCEGAGSLSQELAQIIEARSDIDSKLRRALVDGLERIQANATDPAFCTDTETTPTTTTETETQPTETEPPPTQTTDPDPTPDTVTTPTQETTPTQPTTPTAPTGGTPGGSGGIGTP